MRTTDKIILDRGPGTQRYETDCFVHDLSAGTVIWMVGLAYETGPGAAPRAILNVGLLSKEAWALG